MRLHLTSTPNTELTAIQIFAASQGLEIAPMPNFPNRKVLDFHFLLLPELLKAVPELGRRMWLFDSSEETSDCSASERTNTNILVSFGIDCGDFQTWKEKEVSRSTFEDWLVNSGLVEHDGTGLVVEVCWGRDYDGSELLETEPYCVSAWVEEFGHDDNMLSKLFPFFVLKFADDLKEIFRTLQN